MELLKGYYTRAHAYVEQSGGLVVDIEIETARLILENNYTFALTFEGYVQRLDRTATINQTGTYEIESSTYVERDGMLSQDYYKGVIRFNPKDKDDWGGTFEIYETSRTLLFNYGIILKSDEGDRVYFHSWSR